MELASDEEGAIIHSATSFDPTYPPSKILDGWGILGCLDIDVLT